MADCILPQCRRSGVVVKGKVMFGLDVRVRYVLV